MKVNQLNSTESENQDGTKVIFIDENNSSHSTLYNHNETPQTCNLQTHISLDAMFYETWKAR